MIIEQDDGEDDDKGNGKALGRLNPLNFLNLLNTPVNQYNPSSTKSPGPGDSPYAGNPRILNKTGNEKVLDNADMRGFIWKDGMMRAMIITAVVMGPVIWPTSVFAQVSDPAGISAMIKRFKTDPRGPYLDIRWFCPDGTIRAARDPCPDTVGHQHARYKEEVALLADKDHIFLGQILTGTPYADFWDEEHAHSRLKQYQLEHYLRGIDNGWIHRRAQYYRGAVQVEDENAWGLVFFDWALNDPQRVASQYFLLRQAGRDIPHTADNKNTWLVRSISRSISDSLPAFLDLRVKIHGAPDEGDIGRVRDFQRANKDKIPAALVPKFDSLLQEMTLMYRPFEVSDIRAYLAHVPENSEAALIMERFMNGYPTLAHPADKCRFISRIAFDLRLHMEKPMPGRARLALMDMSNQLEGQLLKESSAWTPVTLDELLVQTACLAEAAAAFGFLERWEWEQIHEDLMPPAGTIITLEQLSTFAERSRQVTEWGAAMVRAHYQTIVNVYEDFEPLAAGFTDDRIRGTILLPLGRAAGRLGDVFAREAGFSNQVMGLPDQSAIRGLNPGYALGELVVIGDSPGKTPLSPDKIYVFRSPPNHLTPVAGIATVSEGNTVSHVQLLARNLGIPNAVISRETMNALMAFQGKRVFYAVSNQGTVIMKPASEMDPPEAALFDKRQAPTVKISVPVDRIVTTDPHIIPLDRIDASHSGKICGPKAANLGQLKKMFPDQVVDGLVLPFAIFRQHMEQNIPGAETTYWEKMKGIFSSADNMRKSGNNEKDVEAFILRELASLRTLIRKMPLLPSFTEELREKFITVLGKPIGEVPVFVRSDTNMEDLKDFTGAGLNLTVFNVLDPEKIVQGIRDVWASPYAERSYAWRQRYLNNPENVYPSILIIPSVDADMSGVLVTKGLASGRDEDMTIAFNRGVGGAVDGQAAETWLINTKGDARLIAPAREPAYLTVPVTGGSVKAQTSFEQPIIRPEHIQKLRILSFLLREDMPTPDGINAEGPYDVELGFKDDHLWLFQVRPFVENKRAAASTYLQRITPSYDPQRSISSRTPL